MNRRYFNTFDIDGVIFLENGIQGVCPNPQDIIISGRSFEEVDETDAMLRMKGIYNPFFLNPVTFNEKTRESSAIHKAKTIKELIEVRKFNANYYQHGVHFEDDPLQIEVIKSIIPWVRIVHVNSSGLVELENKRHP